jgi:hypothetical protein
VIDQPDSSNAEFAALQEVIAALQRVPGQEARQRIFDAASTFLDLSTGGSSSSPPRRAAPTGDRSESHSAYPSFSTDTALSPKEFLLEKQPRTDVERIATLAFYLTHYRDTPHFKTLDISKLNTEAAQPKFSNAASSANNAVKQGYLVPSTKGQRQLSAAGERFVAALPDREEAKKAMSLSAPRRRSRRAKPQKSSRSVEQKT